MKQKGEGVTVIDLVSLGSSASGKTSLIHYFMYEKFYTVSEQQSTSLNNGAMYYSRTRTIGDDNFKFKIWDTSGDDKYRFLLPMYYRSSKIAIVTFDSLDAEGNSFAKAKEIIAELRKEDNPTLIALVATKYDSDGITLPEEIAELSKQHDLIFMNTSAKCGTNIMKLFDHLAVTFKKHLEKQQSSPSLSHFVVGVNSFAPRDSPYETEFLHSIELVNNNAFSPETSTVHVLDKEHAPKISKLDVENLETDESEVTASKEALKAKRPLWAKDESVKDCHKCLSTFTVFVRKHHCRACGNIFCADCSSHFTTIPQMAFHKPVRVCADCHNRLIH